MLFSNSLRNLMLGRGILSALTNPIAITVFSGAQPTAADITSSWITNSPNFLVHWTDIVMDQPEDGLMLSVHTFPVPTAAVNGGTATWGIIWGSNVSQAAIQGSDLPDTKFLVVPVSLANQNGVIRLNATTFATSDVIPLTDVSIVAS